MGKNEKLVPGELLKMLPQCYVIVDVVVKKINIINFQIEKCCLNINEEITYV